mmetsp:Transcript_68714/g.149559  ORF Transcript_68714/g.149559 Transcript_68714/m.149559 type:complete len:130 (+) Transcript_68714:215-604(+)
MPMTSEYAYVDTSSSSRPPALIRSASAPPASATSAEKVPCCTIRPSLSTATASQERTTERLWEATNVVGRSARAPKTAWESASAVAVSRDEVGSSNTRACAPLTKARAAAILCRSPPDSASPPGPTGEE